jgi:nucleotide-binding universal stress UspA family protein
MYFIYRRNKGLRPTGSLRLEDLTIPEYQTMRIKNILVAARSTGGTDALQMACQLARHHHASVTAVYVLEVPHSLPMDAKMEAGEKRGTEALKRAEAVLREYDLTVHLQCLRSRSIEEALLSVIKEVQCDLVIVSADQEEIKNRENFATQAAKLLQDATCRVVFCKA